MNETEVPHAAIPEYLRQVDRHYSSQRPGCGTLAAAASEVLPRWLEGSRSTHTVHEP